MSRRIHGGSKAAKRLLGTGAVFLTMAVLAGCTSNPVQPAASDSPIPSASASAEPTAPAPVPSETVEPVGIPIEKTCDDLLSGQSVYDYNPNFGTDPGYLPADDSAASEIVELEGVACGLLNQTSGERIEVAVARLTADEIEARKNALVSSSQQVPTFSGSADEGYFSMSGDIGRADAFVGDFWIMSDSTVYYEPGDAQPIVDIVAAALR